MSTPSLIWYAPYGSNLAWRRFRFYLEGGYLADNDRQHQGARDPSPPVNWSPIWMPGQAYFATESAFWGGGRGLFDPEARGIAASRAWLITADQFCDVMAQEMNREVGTDFELPVRPGRAHQVSVGDGHYETAVCVGRLNRYPVVTFCAPFAMGDVEPLAPAPAYRAMILSGLRETFSWDMARANRYLDSLSGARSPELVG